jgi:hypothetical protein
MDLLDRVKIESFVQPINHIAAKSTLFSAVLGRGDHGPSTQMALFCNPLARTI